MIRPFKFLTNNRPTFEQLRRYHKRVLDRYVQAYNLNPGQPNYDAGGMIYSAVNHFINEGQLTSYNEIRSYYRIAYEHLNHGEDIIDDFDHNGIIWYLNGPAITNSINVR
jgi:hypothetical protein